LKNEIESQKDFNKSAKEIVFKKNEEQNEKKKYEKLQLKN
jgi:hypothetical protein